MDYKLLTISTEFHCNYRMDLILQGSVGIGVAYFLFGLGLSSYWITRTMNTVRRLVLRKGGKYISVQTYGITGSKTNLDITLILS